MNKQFRITMVGPQPPQRSGIAEYAAGLVKLLRGCGIHVDTVTRDDVDRLGSHEVVSRLLRSEAIVYQMGNHPAYHGWMLPLMARVPGIVHLHDLVLHHMAAGVLNAEQRLLLDDYPAMLDKWYPIPEVQAAAAALCQGEPIWNRDSVIDMPLHQIATKFATQVVVHSRFAAERVRSAFPWLPVDIVPQVYPNIPASRHRARLRTIAIMGGGHLNRRFDWIADALAAIDADLSEPLSLEVVGEVEPIVQPHLDRIAQLRNVRVINHGHADDAEFFSMFERADVLIALRQPTMGETSAVVSKALQAGLPTIVSNHGWYAELPSCVRKLSPTDECPFELTRALRRLVSDPDVYATWAASCAEQARAPSLDATAAAAQYAKIVRNHGVLSRFRDRIADAVIGLGIDVDSPLANELQRIDVRASLRGDRWLADAMAALDGQDLDAKGHILGAGLAAYPYTEALPDDGYLGRARATENDLGTVPPSTRISVAIELTNGSGYPWLSPSGQALRPYGIYVGYFWHHVSSERVPAEQPRTRLERPVDPGSTLIQKIEIQAPDVPGEYHLEVALVQESACWFTSRGFESSRTLLRVEPEGS